MRKALKISALSLVILGALGCGVFSYLKLERNANEVKVETKLDNFQLMNTSLKAVTLADIQKQGTPVLVFYRGHW